MNIATVGTFHLWLWSRRLYDMVRQRKVVQRPTLYILEMLTTRRRLGATSGNGGWSRLVGYLRRYYYYGYRQFPGSLTKPGWIWDSVNSVCYLFSLLKNLNNLLTKLQKKITQARLSRIVNSRCSRAKWTWQQLYRDQHSCIWTTHVFFLSQNVLFSLWLDTSIESRPACEHQLLLLMTD